MPLEGAGNSFSHWATISASTVVLFASQCTGFQLSMQGEQVGNTHWDFPQSAATYPTASMEGL